MDQDSIKEHTMPQRQQPIEQNSIHFTWVGPISPGHDDIGPLSAVSNTMTQINFWCLEKNILYYREYFKNKNIVVRSIESFINEKKKYIGLDENSLNIKALAKETDILFDTVLRAKNRGDRRSFFTVKEAFVFFLLAAEGGFALDTNVIFIKKSCTLPTYPNSRVPAVQYPLDVENIPSDELQKYIDVWAMYSTKNNPAHMMHALRYYLAEVNRIENEEKTFLGEKYTEEYKKKILHVVIKAVMLQHDVNRDVGYIAATRLGSSFPVKVFADRDGGISFVKLYFNTHVAVDRDPQSILMKAVVLGKGEEIINLLKEAKHVENINEISETEYYKNITLLGAAEFYGHTEIAALLRKHGADTSITMELKEKSKVIINPARCNASLYAQHVPKGMIYDDTLHHNNHFNFGH